MEEAFIFSEKVALREALGATALAFALGEVLRTLGAVFLLGVPGFLGAGERGCQSGEEELFLVRLSAPWPLALMVKMSLLLLVPVLTKAILPPPGDQLGSAAPAELLVRRSTPWPLGFMV